MDENGVLILQKNRVSDKNKEIYYGDILDLNIDENIYLNLSTQGNDLEVANLKVAGIIDEMPYSFRLNKPKEYEKEKKEFRPEVILIMTEKTFNKLVPNKTVKNISLDLIGYDIIVKPNINNALIDKSIVNITNKQVENKTVNALDFHDKASDNSKALAKLLLVFAVFIALMGYSN